MARRSLFLLFSEVLVAGLVSLTLPYPALALEKVVYGSGVRPYAGYYLPVLVAEERGFWKANDLEVQWVPFAGTTPMMAAVAAGATTIGVGASDGAPAAAERGIPVVMIAELVPTDPFLIWVRADSPYRHPRELKGTRFGTPRLGGAMHVFGRIVAKAHRIEDMKFIGAGGLPEMFAAIKVGAIDVTALPITAAIGLKLGGVIREIGSMADYLPKPWTEHIIFAHRDWARSKPEVVRRFMRAVLQATDFIGKNPRVSMDKIKSFQGLSEEAAKIIYEGVRFSTTGRIDRKVVENIRNTYIEHGIFTEKAPPVDELFTNEYLP